MSRVFLLSLAVSGLMLADTVTLRNGQTIYGSYAGATSRTIQINDNGRTNALPLADVQRLEMGTQTTPSSQRQQPGNWSGTEDVITLRNGTTLTGTLLGGDNTRFRLLTAGDRVQSVNLNRVTRIDFANHMNTSTGAWSNSASSSSGAWNSNTNQNRTDSSGAFNQAQRGVGRDRRNTDMAREIPTGTRIAVRMIDDADSQRDQVGKTYRASIEEDVVIDGRTLIPRGSDVTVQLMQEEEAGTFSGRPGLTLGLQSINVNGRQVNVVSESVEQTGSSRGKRSAMVIGGTAALGAILGGIAGGGSGAAIGAAAGAGAGTAAQVIFRGSRVRVPSETVFNFTLQEPVRI